MNVQSAYGFSLGDVVLIKKAGYGFVTMIDSKGIEVRVNTGGWDGYNYYQKHELNCLKKIAGELVKIGLKVPNNKSPKRYIFHADSFTIRKLAPTKINQTIAHLEDLDWFNEEHTQYGFSIERIDRMTEDYLHRQAAGNF